MSLGHRAPKFHDKLEQMRKTLKNLIFPQRKRPFYLLKPFLQHEHNSNSCESVYIIPWTNGFFVTTRRVGSTWGCVGCLVRRLLSTTYHKSAIINGIDSVWCQIELETNKTVIEAAQQTLQIPNNPTLCLFFNWKSKTYEKIHIIPVPSCNCSIQAVPKLDHNFVNEWLNQWPNIVLNKLEPIKKFSPFIIKSCTLPNTSWLFSTNLNQEFHIPSNPTAAGFKDSPNLGNRLLGESIERYSLKYLQQDKLYIEEGLRLKATKDHIQDSSTKIWTSVSDIEGNCHPIEADRIYNLLFRINHEKYKPISSSGVAAHVNPEKAKCNALLELLERDALLTSWRLAGQSEVFNLTELPESMLQNVKEINWTIHLLNKKNRSLIIRAVKNQFNLPVCLATSLGCNMKEEIQPLFGSGIAFQWETAVRKALNEILQGLENPNFDLGDKLPETFIERPAYWAKSQNSNFLRNFLNSTSKFESKNDPESFESLQIQLLQSNEKIYFANLTPPDVKLGGWHVFRAIAEDFEPFASSHQHEKPSLKRVNHYLKAIGCPTVSDINTKPFPYP